MAKRPNYGDLVSQAEQAVAAITDPELKRLAFQRVLDDMRASRSTALLESVTRLIQVLSVVAGVVISVLSFNAARHAEAEAKAKETAAKIAELEKYAQQRQDEAERRQAEAAKPFLELRQKLYLEVVQAAAVLANPKDHPEEHLKKARTRFRQLYVAESSLIEGIGVEQKMVAMAKVVDPDLIPLSEAQKAAYELAHALRDSLAQSWKLDEKVVGNPNR
ncbi:MAG: hypothetical protein HY040_04570 [Planctomycetes bacterium]|nr:hypothetical protein [Planctomycetota bacterium]